MTPVQLPEVPAPKGYLLLHGHMSVNQVHGYTAAQLREYATEYSAPFVAELRRLYVAYVRLLESGRDRICDLGGSCDPVDVMEASDIDLRRVRELLALLTTPSETNSD